MAKPKIPTTVSKKRTLTVGNLGKPIKLKNLNLAGISAGSARAGDSVDIWTKLALTSDQALFQKIIRGIAAVIEYSANTVGSYPQLDRAGTVLLVLRPDDTGELWVDAAAMTAYSTLKRPGPIAAGTVLFENDLADLTGIWFPRVKIGVKDRILCIIREGWRFGLFFDFNPDGNLAIEDAKRALATLVRRMRYADLYAALSHQPTFQAIISAGWFPFLELTASEFRELLSAQEAGFGLNDAEKLLLEKFDDARIDRMFARWMERSHLKSKELILRSAINAYKMKDPVSVIKNILSEIEGVMAEAYFFHKKERSHKINTLLKFMLELAEERAGGKDTLFFPVEFGTYLKDYTYAGFDPASAKIGSRHAVGHGAVPSDQYTMLRALQALLTLDQVAFYM